MLTQQHVAHKTNRDVDFQAGKNHNEVLRHDHMYYSAPLVQLHHADASVDEWH